MQSIIFNQTMARVRRIHRMKVFLRSPIPKIVGALALFVAVSSFVSFSHVFQNMPNLIHLESFFRFVGVAFANTELSVQIVSLISTMLVLFAIRDFFVEFRPSYYRTNPKSSPFF